MKKAFGSQIEELEDLKDKIKLSTNADEKIEMFSEVEKILKNIDFMSKFCTDFSGDLLRYKSQKVITMQDSLVNIMEEAISQYRN